MSEIKRSNRKHLKQLRRNAKKRKLHIEGIEQMEKEKREAANRVKAELSKRPDIRDNTIQ